MSKYAVVTMGHTNKYEFTKWHETEDAAVIEAVRLAEKDFGKEFIVLKAVGTAKIPNPRAEFYKEPEHLQP